MEIATAAGGFSTTIKAQEEAGSREPPGQRWDGAGRGMRSQS